MVNDAPFPPMSFDIIKSSGALNVRLLGSWAGVENDSPAGRDPLDDLLESLRSQLENNTLSVTFDSSNLTAWDTRLLVGISKILAIADSTDCEVDLTGLPDGVQALLRLSQAVPPRTGQTPPESASDLLTTVGQSGIDVYRSFSDGTRFLIEALHSFGRFFRGKARFLRSDVVEFIQATGPNALPIVGIINLLLGIILGFMGAVQLRQFGAEIFVANLVALGHP